MSDEPIERTATRHADMALCDLIRPTAHAALDALARALPENRPYQEAYAGRLCAVLERLQATGGQVSAQDTTEAATGPRRRRE